MKLLIVDDEPIIRDGIKALVDLEGLGIEEIFEAENGEQAYKLFELNQPDIVLADINMPRMNGLEFSEKIKLLKPEVRIALITGYDYFDYARQAIKIGVEDYVLKPVSRSDITALLSELVAKVRSDRDRQRVDAIIEGQTAVTVDEVNTELNQSGGVTAAADTSGSLDYRQQILKWLQEHIYDETMSLNALAEHMGLSTGYLSGLFKKEFGQSFKEYVLSKRLDQAKILMLSSNMKNYEIGEAIGITDANYFSAMFKKHIGMSPNAFRKQR